jgi:beta-galactosidase/beta-glucuronidase
MIKFPLKHILLLIALAMPFNCKIFAQKTAIQYLSGVDKDHTVAWDFYCTAGRNSGKWSKIQVPSCWELQGFGTYNYGKIKLDKQSEEQGMYKYNFNVDHSWKGKVVRIVFEGSMTDTEVKINGKIAGKPHQGSFYHFKYDIGDKLNFDAPNTLEVKVSKKSANKSINNAEREVDFWIFGGIFRPVYLEALPAVHIEQISLDAKANGQLNVEVATQGKAATIEAIVEDLVTQQPLKVMKMAISAPLTKLNGQLANVRLWSPEFPNLYVLRVNLKNSNGTIIHTEQKKFGFRTVELRPKDGFYLNDAKVLFKGINRHSFWPSSGRTTSKKISIDDVKMMKDMNMNAVRMSHYPPDEHFLDVCDSLGLMVLDELTGWQQKYDDSTGHRLVKQLIERDVNHASIVMWDNGNEGGFNFNLDQDFRTYDPQKRPLIHPWARFEDTDTKHYPSYNYLVNSSLYDDKVYFPTEFLHGLYDGGHGAGLDDYWNAMLKHPHSAGGFLWVFADEAVERKDKSDSLDASSNEAPDGIVGPYHEKEGSYYTIKEIWSPVYIAQKRIDKTFKGLLKVENRFMFTNLNQCTFTWELKNYRSGLTVGQQRAAAKGTAKVLSLKPGETGWLNLNLPADFNKQDVLYVTARDPQQRELFTWSWPISTAKDFNAQWLVRTGEAPAIAATEQDDLLTITDGNIQLSFNKKTGYLEKVMKENSNLSLSDGPALAGVEQVLTSFTHQKSGSDYQVKAVYKGKDNQLTVSWTISPGLPVKLDYTYEQRGEADFMGISFNYPENMVTGMQWIGRGPYHVWKNRLKGLEFGYWQKAYNNTVTGESGWKYPEFKGNHAEWRWLQLDSKEFSFKVFTESNDLFLQMLKTQDPKGAFNNNTTVNYPSGNLGFMDFIQPIGTKFSKTTEMGPQSQKNIQLNGKVSHVLWFDFR